MVISIEWSCLLMMFNTVFCVGFRPVVDPIVSVSSNLTPESASRYQLEIPVVSDMPHSHSATAVLPSIEETMYHTPTEENIPDLTVNNNNLVTNTQHNVSLVMPCIFNCFRERWLYKIHSHSFWYISMFWTYLFIRYQKFKTGYWLKIPYIFFNR